MDMDEAEQRAGEARVREHLIEPLMRIGLMRPSGLKVDAFGDMQRSLCQRLAYMSAVDLEALREVVETNPAGAGKDRWPGGPWILDRAREISPPQPGASPLIRSVFAHRTGRSALAEGWAPELLDQVRKTRRFPNDDVCAFVRSQARGDVERAATLRRRQETGGCLSDADAAWLYRREEKEVLCQQIAVGQVA
ncbi:hypothetical protein [Sagittula stellata]|uniref:Uncharacterized protein n=1 Tax=Sagittula stellata (strain ATCC 700073 / DSM 11524 / E-37) TaxID=388399 RepID=A3K1Z0_SAGS3|nr:hypothetical protein [Sagittula stellata]EBA08936.1 hypothetical protein SSE37_04800 [Sagittula stellata E-37]